MGGARGRARLAARALTSARWPRRCSPPRPAAARSGSGGGSASSAPAAGSAAAAAPPRAAGPRAAAPPARPIEIGSIIDLTGVDATSGSRAAGGHGLLPAAAQQQRRHQRPPAEGHLLRRGEHPQGAAQCAQQFATLSSHIVVTQTDDPPTRGALPYLTKDLVVSIDPILLPKAGTNVFQSTAAELGDRRRAGRAVKKSEPAHHRRAVHHRHLGDAPARGGPGLGQGGRDHRRVAAADRGHDRRDPAAAQAQVERRRRDLPGQHRRQHGGRGELVQDTRADHPGRGRGGGGDQQLPQEPARCPPGRTSTACQSSSATPAACRRAVVSAWSQYRSAFTKYANQPVDTQTTSAIYLGCVGEAALKASPTYSVSEMTQALKAAAIPCLGVPGEVRHPRAERGLQSAVRGHQGRRDRVRRLGPLPGQPLGMSADPRRATRARRGGARRQRWRYSCKRSSPRSSTARSSR